MKRRTFLKLGGLACAGLAIERSQSFYKLFEKISGPKAKSFVFLTMYGGPSQIETFDYKPELYKRHGQSVGDMVSEYGQVGGEILRPRFSFKQYGESGAWVSEIFPHMAKIVDDITIIKSCTAGSKNHGIALSEMNSGHTDSGYPTLGSWINYALPTLNPKIPGHFVFTDSRGHPQNGEINWSNSFLPPKCSAIPIYNLDVPIPFLNSDKGLDDQKIMNSYLHDLNERFHKINGDNKFYKSRKEGFNLALSMQDKLLEIFNLDTEPRWIRTSYGLDSSVTREFGTQLLLTRKLLESGVRVVQIYHGGNNNEVNWDQHQDMIFHKQRALETDGPIYAFIQDLKAKGLFDDVVILWGGEFGKLPVADLRPEFGGKTTKLGRQHNEDGFTMWMAGGGVKRGFTFGATDELGYKAIENPVTHLDIQATILDLLGIDYQSLSYTDQKIKEIFSTKERKIISSVLT